MESAHIQLSRDNSRFGIGELFRKWNKYMDGAFSNLLLHITFHWHKEWDNNRQSILAFMEMVHMGIKGIVTSRTTGKPIRGLFLLQYFFSFPLLLLTFLHMSLKFRLSMKHKKKCTIFLMLCKGWCDEFNSNIPKQHVGCQFGI